MNNPNPQLSRRDFLAAQSSLAAALLFGFTRFAAGAQTPETTGVPVPVKVDTKGVKAIIKYEAIVDGFLTEINGKYKLRVTEITIAPGGIVGDHNHLGPGIRLMTVGKMDYIMPHNTVIYGPGDFFFEAGNVSHRVINRGDVPCTHLLFEILPLDVQGPSLIPPRDLR